MNSQIFHSLMAFLQLGDSRLPRLAGIRRGSETVIPTTRQTALNLDLAALIGRMFPGTGKRHKHTVRKSRERIMKQPALTRQSRGYPLATL